MFSQIVARTPIWVPVIFLVLAVYGGIQLRTRELNRVKVLMLPIIMTVLSIGGVFSSFGPQPAAIIAWIVGFAAALALNRIIRAPRGAAYDAASRCFHVPGGWTPLALMMAIFFAKYVVGATTAMRPDIALSAEFAAVLSCLFGGVSGTFFARFLQIWTTARQDPAVPSSVAPSQDWKPAS